MPQQPQQISYLSQRKQMFCWSMGSSQCSDYNVPDRQEQYTINSFGFCCSAFQLYTLQTSVTSLPSYLHFFRFSFYTQPSEVLVTIFKNLERQKSFHVLERKPISCHNLKMRELMCHTHFCCEDADGCYKRLLRCQRWSSNKGYHNSHNN